MSCDAEPGPAALPDLVRRRVLELAAAALGGLPEAQVPSSLAQVRRFAPGRRAGAGARPLATALERDEAFRSSVAAAVRDAEPELAQALDQGGSVPAGDPVEVAAVAYLLRSPRRGEQLEAALQAVRDQAALAESATVQREVERLTRALADAQAELQRLRADVDAERQGLLDELASVRRELRRHRSDADRARSQARSAADDAAVAVEQAERAAQSAEQRALRAEAELGRSREALEALRRADREGRSLAGSRARLLLDTVVEAATGLRRELGLAPADVMPADLVGESADEEQVGTAAPPVRARADDDPSVLAELLSMPRAHLIVDGYNVTKSAYGDLPLADQRARLVAGLSTLQARTRAEITCCFDGAVVEGRVATPSARGVRVRFSAPGEIADELIRRLMRAEPEGRVVVVVSSDREVADGVRAAGARPVPSPALARLLDRG
ncbi:MAG TPA: NYN domain-containing protein [Angustibacter sp.]|nr:NYN domain-containing protein [Angustibacter sp.]